MSQPPSGENSPAPKKGKKKGKGKTMDLQTFLGDKKSGTNFNKDPPKKVATSSNWADATEDIDPAEITTSWPEEKEMFDRSVLPSAPRASSAIQLDMSRLPPHPPYTIYLGNLSFECTPDDIIKFFERKKLQATSVRLPMESGTSRMRGFGYAEFGSLDQLKEALSLDKEPMKNRPVQIDIAGDKDHGGGRGRRDQEDDRTTGNWRRGGDDFPRNSPPGREFGDRDDRRYGGRGGQRERFGSRDGPDRSFDRRESYGRDRGYDSRDSGYRGGQRDSYGSRDEGYGNRDSYNRDRGFRDSRDGNRDSYGSRDGGYGGGRNRYGSGDYDRGDRGYDRGPRRGDAWGDDDRRGGRYGDRGHYDDRGGRDDRREYGREEPPAERPRLKIQPRSKPLEDITPTEEQSKNSSIFGGAKPVDTAAKEKEIEERRIKEQEEKERVAKERQEKNAALFGGAKPVDTAAREKEIEEKMAKKQEEVERKISQDKEKERTPDRAEEERNKTPEVRDNSRERKDDRNTRGSRGGGRRRRFSSEEEGRQSSQPRRKDEGSRDTNEQRPPTDRGDRGEYRRRGGGPRRDERRNSDRNTERGDGREYYNDRGGRGRGRGSRSRDDRSRDDRSRDDRPRDDRRDDDPRGGKGTNAWSRGKPRSLGGAEQRKVLENSEPVVFSQPSRYATLEDENDSGEETPPTTSAPTNSEN